MSITTTLRQATVVVMLAWLLSGTTALAETTPRAKPAVVFRDIEIPAKQSAAQQRQVIGAAKAFYAFWNDGSQRELARAIAPAFVDHTLPPGRPQGPQGPAYASRQFLTAVPDLHVIVDKMIVAGPYVTVHMHFTGHFTGRMGTTQGHGQPVDFIATDLLKISDGRITDNWHLEDNATLFQQMGIAG